MFVDMSVYNWRGDVGDQEELLCVIERVSSIAYRDLVVRGRVVEYTKQYLRDHCGKYVTIVDMDPDVELFDGRVGRICVREVVDVDETMVYLDDSTCRLENVMIFDYPSCAYYSLCV